MKGRTFSACPDLVEGCADTNPSSRGGFTRRGICFSLIALLLLLPGTRATAAGKPKTTKVQVPELLLPEGRKLTFQRSFTSDRDVRPKPGFFTKIFDFAVGAPDVHFLVRPYSVVEDSRGRIIVTDPGAQGIHILDPVQLKYKFIERKDKNKDAMRTPQCVAVDDKDNIYVTDSESGKIFVFNADGKYQRALGSLKGGEGFFKRPTGIAVDSAEQHIYVTDTLRDKIYVLDMDGSVVKTIGQSGNQPAEFNYPTELRLNGNDLVVVDAMNFRVQVLDRAGQFQYAIGAMGDGNGAMSGPKASASIPKAMCMSSRDRTTWCRFSIARVSCFTTSASRAAASATSACRQAFSSTTTIASSSSTPITTACRCSSTPPSSRPREARNEIALPRY